MRHFLLAGTMAALALIAAACFGGGGGGPKTPEPTPTPPVPAAEDVIAAWVRSNRNVEYAGDCAGTQIGVDVGKICSTLIGERGRTRAYSLGPTFSEYTMTMLLQEGDAGWTVLSATNRDPNAEVPGIEWPLEQGDRVVFIGLGADDCLSIREQPALAAGRTICMGDGTEAIVMDGPVEADGFTWWQVAGDGFNGWAVAKYMRLPEALEQLFATPTPAPE